MSEMPENLRDLDEKLRAIRFRPAPSLQPELLGRLGRGEPPSGRYCVPRHLATAAAALLTAGTALAFASFTSWHTGQVVSVDRCCYDLDGGGPADDGVLVLAQRNSKVHRLRVYEDIDGSRSYSAADLIRLDRGEKPAILSPGGDGIVSTDRCCLDFDGGGPEDDGLLVIGAPPDRVFMAAIYETGAKSGDGESGEARPLR